MVAFWGCEVTETKAAIVEIPEGYVLNACNVTCGASSADTQLALGLETQQLDGKMWKGVAAYVGAKQPLHVKLDLVFGHKVKFYLAKGSGVVHVTGYFQPGPPTDVVKEEAGKEEMTAPKQSVKRAREETKPKVEESKSVSKKKVKPAKEDKNDDTNTKGPDAASTTPGESSEKKKRKKKHKKPASNGEINEKYERDVDDPRDIKHLECVNVASTNAFAHPRTVVVVPSDADATIFTMFHGTILVNAA
ncbi:hypothetical protein PsorP6_000512 [Peronosclerospora sorghi]|uniref:Uncharacterized protein n=1 Tax=Peronosclerospora sorghi TaxID=230839 RepID=A0ACC0WQR6_9STRA|nr:hypothetical protein PsorP6_000512 [Peronosclerospora sorghi]